MTYVLLNDFGVAVVVGEFIAAFNRFNGDKAFFFALFVLNLEFSGHVAFDDFIFGFFGDVFDFHFEGYFGFAVFVFDFKLEFAHLLVVFVDFVFVFDFLSAVFNFYGLFDFDVVIGVCLAFGGEFDGSFFFVAFGFNFLFARYVKLLVAEYHHARQSCGHFGFFLAVVDFGFGDGVDFLIIHFAVMPVLPTVTVMTKG